MEKQLLRFEANTRLSSSLFEVEIPSKCLGLQANCIHAYIHSINSLQNETLAFMGSEKTGAALW